MLSLIGVDEQDVSAGKNLSFLRSCGLHTSNRTFRSFCRRMFFGRSNFFSCHVIVASPSVPVFNAPRRGNVRVVPMFSLRGVVILLIVTLENNYCHRFVGSSTSPIEPVGATRLVEGEAATRIETRLLQST